MAICTRLVEVLGGEIGVDSEVGRGSKFHFTIALRPGAGAAATAHRAVEAGVARRRHRRRS